MLKQFYFGAAVFWTGIIVYFSLVQCNDLPFKSVSNIDKLVHSFFHFVFIILWFLYFNIKLKCLKLTKFLLISVVFSMFFGIGIEILQEILTTSRHADVVDVFANISGASLASIFIFYFYGNIIRIKI
ncbi:VanZ family protein [Flavobacterium sp.]|uniref:VanZ family protein n=1 Tax=Flavobacterium sp. TaxID=239 RepID=UPI0038FD0502